MTNLMLKLVLVIMILIRYKRRIMNRVRLLLVVIKLWVVRRPWLLKLWSVRLRILLFRLLLAMVVGVILIVMRWVRR